MTTAATRALRFRTRAREVARVKARSARAWTRTMTPGALPDLPDFLVIGGMRCGTTSLFRHLAAHPEVHPALGKELNYFTLHYGNGLGWYRGHFPHRPEGHLSFEASPYYLFSARAPRRVAQSMPDVKLVVLLRNPVDRAYSHYLHTRRRGFEPLSFAAALQVEADRLSRPGAGSERSQDPARLFSYVSRGKYAEQLERWLEYFSRDRLFVIRSEDLFSQPGATVTGLAEFLGITPVDAPFKTYAATPREATSQLTPELRRSLCAQFAPHNQRLADLVGWPSAWSEEVNPSPSLSPIRAAEAGSR